MHANITPWRQYKVRRALKRRFVTQQTGKVRERSGLLQRRLDQFGVTHDRRWGPTVQSARIVCTVIGAKADGTQVCEQAGSGARTAVVRTADKQQLHVAPRVLALERLTRRSIRRIRRNRIAAPALAAADFAMRAENTRPSTRRTSMDIDTSNELEIKAGIPHDAVVTHGEMMRAFRCTSRAGSPATRLAFWIPTT